MNPLITSGISLAWHSIRRTFSIICVLLVAAGIYYSVYRTFIKPRPTENYSQKAEQIINNETNYYPNKRIFFFGITLFGTDLGISKYEYPKDKVKK